LELIGGDELPRLVPAPIYEREAVLVFAVLDEVPVAGLPASPSVQRAVPETRFGGKLPRLRPSSVPPLPPVSILTLAFYPVRTFAETVGDSGEGQAIQKKATFFGLVDLSVWHASSECLEWLAPAFDSGSRLLVLDAPVLLEQRVVLVSLL